MKETMKQIKFFLILLLILIVFPTAMIIKDGLHNSSFIFTIILTFAPAVAAGITLLRHNESIKSLGLKKAKLKYFAYGYFIPLIACLFIYIPTWLSGLGAIGDIIWWETLLNTLLAPFLLIVLVIGEDIGWSGFLFPKLLSIMSFHKAVWITGIIWTLFHLPIIFFAGYTGNQPVLYSALMFGLGIMGGTYISGYLRISSGSILPILLLHASHNTFFQMVFDGATVEGPLTSLWTTEFGFGVVVCYSIISIVLVKKLKKELKEIDG